MRLSIWKSVVPDNVNGCSTCSSGARWVVHDSNDGAFIHFTSWREAMDYALWLVTDEKPVRSQEVQD